MSFAPSDPFLRRLIRQSHFTMVKGGSGTWRLSSGVFKYASQPLENGWRRCSVDHECPENTSDIVLARHRAADSDCGLARITHSRIDALGAVVQLQSEGGNEFHCDLDYPDGQHVPAELAAACEIVAWPPSLVQPNAEA